ncbi:hypothetical protein H0H87_006909 [Tephrocybe sp. NHM501043]|nr:hypothetical protein H0H87_006909 [Tephrocybe sp. NHM501043]
MDYFTNAISAADIEDIMVLRRPGGWVHSERVQLDANSLTVEAGPRTLRPNSKAVLELINLLNLQSELLTTPRTSPAAQNRFLYLPDLQPGLTAIPTSILAFLRSPLRQLLLPAILSEPLQWPNRNFTDESLHSFLARRFGSEVARTLGSALCHGVYAADSREVSVQAAFPSLYDLEDKGNGRIVFGILKDILGQGSKKKAHLAEGTVRYELGDVQDTMRGVAVYSFRGGMQSLTDALAQALTVKPNVELSSGENIIGIEMCEDEDSSLTVSQVRLIPYPIAQVSQIRTSTRTLKPSHIVSALPLPVLTTILPSASSHARPLPYLTSNPTSSVTVVNLIFAVPPNTLHPPGFGYLVPRPRGGYPGPTDVPNMLGVLGTVFDSCTLPAESKNDSEYTKLTVMLGGPYRSPLPANDDELRSRVLEYLSESLQTSLPEPVAFRVWRHMDCIPTPTVGHVARMEDLRKVLEETEGRGAWRGRLAVIGAGVGGVSVGDCVEAGKRVGAHWKSV